MKASFLTLVTLYLSQVIAAPISSNDTSVVTSSEKNGTRRHRVYLNYKNPGVHYQPVFFGPPPKFYTHRTSSQKREVANDDDEHIAKREANWYPPWGVWGFHMKDDNYMLEGDNAW